MKSSLTLTGIAVLAAAMLLMVPSALALAQGGGSQGGGGSIGSSGAGTRDSSGRGSTSSASSTDLSTEQPAFPEIRRPIFLQGTVVMDDGSTVPSNVVIERVCSGQRIPEGHANSKGQFAFEVGRNSALIADASTSSTGFGKQNTPDAFGRGGFGTPGNSGSTERDLMGCSLRAVIAGYWSSTIELTGHRFMDSPEVGTIILRKMGERAGLMTSLVSLQAPKKAKKCFQKAAKHAKKQRWHETERELNKAIEHYPDYAEAWYILGQVHEAQQRPEEARLAYGKALTADEKYYQPYMKLAMMDARQARWQEVARTTDKVLKANPYDFPVAYYLNSLANLNLNNNPAAEKSAREAIKMDLAKRLPQVEHILGLALANQDNLDEAATHLEKYLEIAPNAGNAEMVRSQLAEVKSLQAQ